MATTQEYTKQDMGRPSEVATEFAGRLNEYYRWMTNRKLLEFQMPGFDFGGDRTMAKLPNDFYYQLGFFGDMTTANWTTISLLRYYIDPQYINSPAILHSVDSQNYRDPMNFNDSALSRRIDNNAGVIANGATNSLMGVLFPEGFDSFSIRFDKARQHLDPNDVQTPFILKRLEQIATDELRKLLVSTAYSLHSKISAMLFDYINYGTAIAVWENNNLHHAPFMQCALASSGGTEEQMMTWTKPLTIVELIKKKQYYATNDATKQILPHYQSYIYASGALMGNPGKYYCIHSTITNAPPTSFEYDKHHEIELLPAHADFGNKSPIMVARMNHDGSRIYGVGCGLKALSEIFLMNYYSNLLKLTTMCSIYPAVIVPDNLNFEQVSIMAGNTINGDASSGAIASLPGSRIAIGVNTEVAAAGQKPEVLKPDDQRIAEQAMICQQNVEKAYYMEIIAILRGQAAMERRGGGGPMTATQAQIISNLTITELRGLLGNFYDQIVNPIVHIYANKAMTYIIKNFGDDLEVIKEATKKNTATTFDPTKDYNLNYYSYSRSIKAKERSEMSMNYAMMLKNMAIELAPDSPEMEMMKRNYLEAMD